jgi:hypothetical protein
MRPQPESPRDTRHCRLRYAQLTSGPRLVEQTLQPFGQNREPHLRAVLTSTPSFAATAVLPSPSAAANTILERIANAFALFARRVHAVNCARSSSVSSTAGAEGPSIVRYYRTKVRLLTHDTSTGLW